MVLLDIIDMILTIEQDLDPLFKPNPGFHLQVCHSTFKLEQQL